MYQSTTPSLLQTIWPRWASRQFLSLPIVQTLLPVTFAYSLLWDNWGDERSCDEGHWHAHTRGLLWGLPKVVGTVQQVYCNRRILLWRGLEFHVCTMNKSVHTKKSLETYLMILVCYANVPKDLFLRGTNSKCAEVIENTITWLLCPIRFPKLFNLPMPFYVCFGNKWVLDTYYSLFVCSLRIWLCRLHFWLRFFGRIHTIFLEFLCSTCSSPAI